MTLVLAATTVTVWRLPQDSTRDGYDTPPDREPVMRELRATVGSPSGGATLTVGNRQVTAFGFTADPFDFKRDDLIQDEQTGEKYILVWVKPTGGLGFEFMTGALRQVEGAG